jgi:magnesium-transporting ATPase (P-type)
MATVYSDDKKANYAFVKGAPDFMLEHCTKFISKNGSISKINESYLT